LRNLITPGDPLEKKEIILSIEKEMFGWL